MTTTTTGHAPALMAADCVRKRRRTRALAIVAATAATFTAWTIAHPVAGIDLIVDTGSGQSTVTPAAVVVVTVLAGLAAWASLALMERFTPRAAAIWTWISATVLVLSLLGPVGSAVGTATAVTLLGMHLATGAVLIPIMARSGLQCRQAS